MQLPRLFLAIGAVGAGVSVALGALAAHGLKARLDAATLGTFQTGVTYQFFHSIALCLVALWLRQLSKEPTLGGPEAVAGFAFVVGILLFSGSLYALALGGPRWLGPVTPLGGLAFIVGWLTFAWSACRN
jgi:uncharacterized membrane protein YgdD (TMEM256/DUF423 family)